VFNVGPLEIVLVLVIALIVLGPQRMPDVARSVGKGMREFRDALTQDHDDEDDDVIEAADAEDEDEDDADAGEKTKELPEGS
jgi:sec-independent protein translocase protein TatA